MLADIESVDVAVIGAGVSGLAAAYELTKRRRSVAVLERGTRTGGVIWTERVGEFLIDAGPDSLLIQKPAALALCSELAIADRLFPTKVPRTAFILRHGRLHPLPGASMLGFPTRLGPLFSSSLFSTTAKLRMAAELFVPRRKAVSDEDESIGGFVRRRFGQEAVTYVAEPLLAGIHAGDVERLSMRALFPRLIDAEEQAGSVIRSFMRESRQPHADGVFRSFPNGLGELIAALVNALPRHVVRVDSAVTRLDKAGGFTLEINGAPALRARAVIAAVPAFAAADLLQPLDSELAEACTVDPFSLDGNGGVCVSARCDPPPPARHRLRCPARGGDQHHGWSLDHVQVAVACAGRPRADPRISRRSARPEHTGA